MVLKGSRYEDERGILTFNNTFDATAIKRIYTIENNSTEFLRGWQGHTIEQRWFACLFGSFEVKVIKLDNAEEQRRDLAYEIFILTSDTLDYLHVRAGCITAIRALETNSKLLVMSDYGVGEVEDLIRFEPDYFGTIKI